MVLSLVLEWAHFMDLFRRLYLTNVIGHYITAVVFCRKQLNSIFITAPNYNRQANMASSEIIKDFVSNLFL